MEGWKEMLHPIVNDILRLKQNQISFSPDTQNYVFFENSKTKVSKYQMRPFAFDFSSKLKSNREEYAPRPINQKFDLESLSGCAWQYAAWVCNYFSITSKQIQDNIYEQVIISLFSEREEINKIGAPRDFPEKSKGEYSHNIQDPRTQRQQEEELIMNEWENI